MNYAKLGLNAPCRDKYWREKTTDEKVEVLADLLVDAHRKIRQLHDRVDELIAHAHHPHTGMVMVTPRDQHGMGGGYPVGYNHEEFVLGRAPPDHYDPPQPIRDWPTEANAAGSMPVVPHAPEPPVVPEKGTDVMPDSVKSEGVGIYADPSVKPC